MLQVRVHANPLQLIVPITFKIFLSLVSRAGRKGTTDVTVSSRPSIGKTVSDVAGKCTIVNANPLQLIVPITIKIFLSLAPRTGMTNVTMSSPPLIGKTVRDVAGTCKPLQLIVPITIKIFLSLAPKTGRKDTTGVTVSSRHSVSKTVKDVAGTCLQTLYD